MSANCEITPIEMEQLCNNVDAAMQNSDVAEWFSGKWDDIKHEAEILYDGKLLRPDRVMIKDRRAVVVDYKLGYKTSKYYTEKMTMYIDRLNKMGMYDTIEGYIWYINLDRIDRI